VAQLQAGENQTHHQSGETGSEMKLTDFQKKNGGPKSSIIAPRLGLQEVGVGDSSHTSYSQDHFKESAYTRQPITLRKVWAKTP
jgi:hypothetical protein